MSEERHEISNDSADKKKDVLVSIILTESTTSVLHLQLPELEDVNHDAIHCAIQSTRTDGYEFCKACQSCGFTNYWFGNEMETSGTNKESEDQEVLQDVTYFSENRFDNDSLLSLETDSVSMRRANSGTALSKILKPTKVCTCPLVTAKSLPGTLNLITKSDHLCDSFYNDKEPCDSGSSNVCRICHGGESSGNLVSPCDCRGSIAFAHMDCLERWLKESSNSQCELCNHQFVVIREPKYSIPKSIYLFLRHPGDHLGEILFDLFAFIIYTPAAVVSTYMLVLLCETVAKTHLQYNRNASSHIITLSAVLGMAAIDFTYSSWLMVNLQKHFVAWKSWYRNNSKLRIVLPEDKQINVPFDTDVD